MLRCGDGETVAKVLSRGAKVAMETREDSTAGRKGAKVLRVAAAWTIYRLAIKRQEMAESQEGYKPPC